MGRIACGMIEKQKRIATRRMSKFAYVQYPCMGNESWLVTLFQDVLREIVNAS
jgi:hypothetical protein